jgi:16S rRNA A1518/A1519 N6-dimethyltransferase RsmA/KsgA/DIM1 with predicted DNA glycosylase/AP lyase activity
MIDKVKRMRANVIPVEKLSAKELEEDKKDLEEALRERSDKRRKGKKNKMKDMFGADKWLRKTGMDDVRNHHGRKL